MGEETCVYSYDYFMKKSNTLNRLKYKLPNDSLKKFSLIKQKLFIKESADFKRYTSLDKTVLNKQKEELGEIYKILNKITDKTYDKLSVQILDIIQKIENEEQQNELCEKIFSIISTNSFFSELYTKLYAEMIKIDNSFHKIFNFHYDKYKESFNQIEYVSPNEDYDKYCNYIKLVDNIQSITKFFINCLNYSICTPDNIIDLLLLFQQKMIDQLEIQEKIYENENYINNIYLIIKEQIDILSFHEKWEYVLRNNTFLHENKGNGKNNKIKFKIMDINDLISKHDK